ncbi:MAG: hypothetical protein ACOC5E_03340 [Acidobacteriota bacterium]
MRVAVALPSLPRLARLRLCLDRVVEALVELGVEVEAFAERDRVPDGADVPLFHYLRFDERHRAGPFQAALWPLGRDARTWEAAWILGHRFPGTAWVLDEPLHHAAYRVHDPMRGRLRAQRHVVHAFPGGRGDAARGATTPKPVPLPAASGALQGTAASPAAEARVAILSMDVIRPDVDVSIVVPEPTYHVRVAPATDEAGIVKRVRWLLSPGSSGPAEELRPRGGGQWRLLRQELFDDFRSATSVCGSRERIDELLEDVLPDGRGGHPPERSS